MSTVAVIVVLLLQASVAGAAATPRASSVAQQRGSSPDAAALVKVWEDYRRALIERNGAAAVALVTPASVADYERVRQLALTLSRAELLQADTLDRYLVLMLRARLSGTELRGMSGADLLRISVEKGWVGSNLPGGIKFLRIDGDSAFVTIVRDGARSASEIPVLKRVDGRWFVDLIELTRLSRPALLALFSKLADAGGTDVNAAMVAVIAKLIGARPPDTIWDPPATGR